MFDLSVPLLNLEVQRKKQRWRFPDYRFIEFSEEDEQHALLMGWSLWGGEAYDEISSMKTTGYISRMVSSLSGQIECDFHPITRNTE